MNVVYLIDTGKNSYHTAILPDFTQVVPGNVIDMSDGDDIASKYYEIVKLKPDVVITFDLAGHLLRTSSDTLSLNNIHARMAHILFHKSDHYGRDLRLRQNLSMFTYIPGTEDAAKCRQNCPYVPNIDNFAAFDNKASTDEEHEKNREGIRFWWSEFKKEAKI